MYESRREFRRYRPSKKINAKIIKNNKLIFCSIYDISSNGMAFTSDVYLTNIIQINDRLIMEFLDTKLYIRIIRIAIEKNICGCVIIKKL